MKNTLLIVICCLPLLTFSQKQPENKPAVKQDSKTENKSDTIIVNDPLNQNRKYWVIHNMKGVLKAQGFILNGKKDGAWREYNDVTGVIMKLNEYKEGIQNGTLLTFSNNGSVQVEETYLNDKKNGERHVFGNFGGRMKTLENYKEDILEGIKKTFYDDGKVQEEGNYKKGKRDGVVKWYLQNGNQTMEYTYSNGELQGPAKVFDEKGNLKLSGEYRKDNEEGEWKEFQDSLLVKKIIYKQGQILKEVPVKK